MSAASHDASRRKALVTPTTAASGIAVIGVAAPFLASAEARLETLSGRVSAAWRKGDESFALKVAVPVGATGEVHVPLFWPGARILESGHDVWRAGRGVGDALGIELTGDDGKWAVFKVGSGEFEFEMKRV